ncbi:hypothetical protein [Desulfovibrio gilichinskyi]|uniref:Uncharacterized protein n=1 Tax=Desulfovibrio gilichinskyi TaxID=1519643 RepID=A0A1X7E0W6_9BACT|nr:hypothetical protein [Desulfovibrio gilichinskyi]SMF25411.1 hypothetical protein SAMN06295933_2470 [Desulfovibrio gilichinskyi]
MGSSFSKCSISNFTSRKGGVGKTTLSLLKAKEILDASKDQDAKIIFFDLDINGTDTVKTVNRLNKIGFWNKSLEVGFSPKDSNNDLQEQNSSDDKTNPLNIVSLFENYMAGTEFSVEWISHGQKKSLEYTNYPTKQTLFLTKNKINVIGSFLNKNSVYTPDVLFDQMHSIWLIDMIKSIIGSALNGSETSLYIIFDNSPGYTGLLPALEDWLTDLGPVICKFYFITTLDGQDFIGAVDSLERVKGQIQAKTYAVHDYMLAVNEAKSTSDKPDPNKRTLFRDSKKQEIKNYREKYDLFYSKLLSLGDEETYCPFCETSNDTHSENSTSEKTSSEKTASKNKKTHKCQRCNFCYYRQIVAEKVAEADSGSSNNDKVEPIFDVKGLKFSIITNKALTTFAARALYNEYLKNEEKKIEDCNTTKLDSKEELMFLYSLATLSEDNDDKTFSKIQPSDIRDLKEAWQSDRSKKSALILTEQDSSKPKSTASIIKDFHGAIKWHDTTLKDILDKMRRYSDVASLEQELSLQSIIKKFIKDYGSFRVDENQGDKSYGTDWNINEPDYIEKSTELYRQNNTKHNISQFENQEAKESYTKLAESIRAVIACISAYSPEDMDMSNVNSALLNLIMEFIYSAKNSQIKEFHVSPWNAIYEYFKKESSLTKIKNADELDMLLSTINIIDNASRKIFSIKFICDKLFEEEINNKKKQYMLRVLHLHNKELWDPKKRESDICNSLQEVFRIDNLETIAITTVLIDIQQKLCNPAARLRWSE